MFNWSSNNLRDAFSRLALVAVLFLGVEGLIAGALWAQENFLARGGGLLVLGLVPYTLFFLRRCLVQVPFGEVWIVQAPTAPWAQAWLAGYHCYLPGTYQVLESVLPLAAEGRQVLEGVELRAGHRVRLAVSYQAQHSIPRGCLALPRPAGALPDRRRDWEIVQNLFHARQQPNWDVMFAALLQQRLRQFFTQTAGRGGFEQRAGRLVPTAELYDQLNAYLYTTLDQRHGIAIHVRAVEVL